MIDIIAESAQSAVDSTLRLVGDAFRAAGDLFRG